MSKYETPEQPDDNEVNHYQAELNRLYNYLIDNYGVDTTYESSVYHASSDQNTGYDGHYELTQQTSVFAFRIDTSKDKSAQSDSDMSTKETLIKTDRIVDLPVSPARNPNERRRASLIRRQTGNETPSIFFRSWTVKLKDETRFQHINPEAVDITPEAESYHRLGESQIEEETGPAWFDYLIKVRRYRDTGLYEQEAGYKLFIEQNLDLIAAAEEAMGFQENDVLLDQEEHKESKVARKQQYDTDQLALTNLFLDGCLSNLNYTKWRHIPDLPGNNMNAGFEERSRAVRLAKPTESSFPTLIVREVQERGSALHVATGPITKYYYALTRGESVIADTNLRDDHSPDIPYYKTAVETVVELIGKIVPEILSEQAIVTAREQIAQIHGPLSITAEETSRVLLIAVWNEVMKKYSGFKPESITG